MATALDPYRVLLVEDDYMYQKMLSYLLKSNPRYEIRLCSNGQECLDQLSFEPDIVLLDYSLPDFSGEELLKKIKRYRPEAIVVFLSGMIDQSSLGSYFEQGAYDFLSKDKTTKARLKNVLKNILQYLDLRRQVNQYRTGY